MEEATHLSVDVGSSISVSRRPGTPGPIGLAQGRRLYPAVKRAIDFAVALTALVVLSPLLVLIALLIKIYSPGPALYIQERIGYDPRTQSPRPFKMYKFRSMHCNADTKQHREHMAQVIQNKVHLTSPDDSLKLQKDSRITGIGHILRDSSLDELPQLINILIGDMSLVGPRPALPYEVEMYEEWHKARLLITPGLTGLWQATARNSVTFDEMVRMDLEYIAQMSFGLDLKILLLTPLAVIKGDGAG